MEKFNEGIIFNYKPSVETMTKALLTQEKLGKLNVLLQEVFEDYKIPSRLFAFVESKYSSKIEGIYTTLFDVVNTGVETKQQRQIRPLVDELFKSKELITLDRLDAIAAVLNTGIHSSVRFKPEFGIYKSEVDKKIKIYEPPLDFDQVKALISVVIKKSAEDKNIVQMLHTHIMFEKVHPYQDGNGRLGRLVLQKSISRLMNFSNVVPLSYAIFSELSKYYTAFEIASNDELDNGISNMLDILIKMCEVTELFTLEVKKYLESNLAFVKSVSSKMTDKIAKDILLSLQTKSKYLVQTYGLNVKTIDSIFEKLNENLSFNRKLANRNVLFWNIELETLVDHYFKD